MNPRKPFYRLDPKILPFLKEKNRVFSCSSEPFYMYICKMKSFLVTTYLSLV